MRHEPFSVDVTKKLARLACLELDDQECVSFTRQIEKVLGYMKLLEDVDVEGVDPFYQPSVEEEGETLLREDVIHHQWRAEVCVYRVPKVIG